MNIAGIRTDYSQGALDEAQAGDDPLALFSRWFDESTAAKSLERNAVSLATVSDGQPSVRIVLLKGFDANGFVFFTNYESRKGHDLAVNPAACMLAFWPLLERQVRIEGLTRRVSSEESDAYFLQRPRDARIGAWASPQSAPLPDRAAIESKFEQAHQRFGNDPDAPVPRPPHWGGYRLIAQSIEFWQGRPSRLHDRLLYRRSANNDAIWQRSRLAP